MGSMGMREFVLKDEPLGIFETELRIRNDKVERKLSLHYLFSYYDGQLYCRCLDFNVYTRLDLKEEAELINQSDNNFLTDFAQELVRKASKNLTWSIMDHILMRKDYNDRKYTLHSREEYWKEYRKIREEMSDGYLNEYFYPDEKNAFTGLNEAIEKKLKDIQEELNAIIVDSNIAGAIETPITFFNKKFDEKLSKSAA